MVRILIGVHAVIVDVLLVVVAVKTFKRANKISLL